MIHDDPLQTAALGCSGTGIGFAASPNSHCFQKITRSLAIELDSFFNVTKRKLKTPYRSLNASTVLEWEHQGVISAYRNGSNDHSLAPLAAHHTRALESNFQINNGRVHALRVKYTPPEINREGRVVVSLDDVENILEFQLDLGEVTDKEGWAWLGFTGATGLGSENLDLISWRVCAGVCEA